MVVVAVVTRMVRLRSILVLGASVALAAGIVVAAFPSLVSTSLHEKDDVAGQNVSERLDLWTAAGHMTLQHPVLGMGPGAFAQDHSDFITTLPDDVNHPLDVAHNTWLEISSELGVVGLLAFVAMLGSAFAQAWSARRAGDPLGAGICAALVGTVVAATFVTEQYYLPLWLLTALAVGVGRSAASGEEPG
jgi:O-antigen ligase